jgi:hypothetical protein
MMGVVMVVLGLGTWGLAFGTAKGLLPNPILSFSRRASLPAAPDRPDDESGGVLAS